ncbi:MAG: hypothetical protein ACM3SS_16295, partial [Rhodospirillaceae bacterium]
VDVAVKLTVVAHDNAGRTVKTSFHLRIGGAKGEGPAQEAEATPHMPDARAPSGDGSGDERAGEQPATRSGARTFTEQLREARKDRLYDKVLGVLAKPAARHLNADGVKVSARLALRQ